MRRIILLVAFVLASANVAQATEDAAKTDRQVAAEGIDYLAQVDDEKVQEEQRRKDAEAEHEKYLKSMGRGGDR